MSEFKRLNIADEKFSRSKVFGFSLLRLGNILQGLLIGEVTYFATNSLAISAAAISTGVAIKTAIDAVTDLIMGSMVDGTHSKYGKLAEGATGEQIQQTEDASVVEELFNS